MKRRNASIPEISLGPPRRGFSTPSPVRPVARIKNSPTLFFGDIGSFDSILEAVSSKTRKKAELKKTEIMSVAKMELEDQQALETDNQGPVNPDLLFAWLSPIEKKVDDRLRTKSTSPAVNATHSPFLRAFRRTFRTATISGGAPASLRARRHTYKIRVREANDACLWLRAAGFPQYVQMFEDGQFPINLSKIQVEKDHAFLEQADIDSLVRRLNILNRCADLMEEIKSKKDDDSEDETLHRALSDHWTFRRRKKKWSRKSRARHRDDSFSNSLEDILAEEDSEHETPTESSPLLLVTELRKSLTGLDRCVKTYSFLPSEDQVPKIVVNSTPPEIRENLAFEEEAASSNHIGHELSVDEGLGGEDDELFSEYDTSTFPRGGMDTFASDMFTTFESNLVKLKSQSLPDFFSKPSPEIYHSSDEEEEDRSLERSPGSSASTSTTSILHSRDSILEDPIPSTPILTGPKLNSVPHREIGTKKTEHVHAKESSLSSEAYESCESEFSRSRPETPISPQKRVTATHHEKASVKVSSDRWSSSSSSFAKKNSQRSDFPKWHSFQKAHSYRQAFKPVRTLIPIEELSVGQISVLKKLSLIKLTALIELYKAKSNIARILKERKHKHPDMRHKSVFGVPLLTNVQRSGRALPPSILAALDYLTQNSGLNTNGLFRRGASKAKIDGLKLLTEANPDLTDYGDFTCYEVADFVKLYFRELPEPILTSKLSETLIMIQENVPGQLRLQAFQSVMLLMPDENREALQTLLLFLKQVADNSRVNQMDASNLAVCLAPSLFAISHQIPKPPSNLARVGSFRRTAVNGHNSTRLNSPAALANNRMVNESVASSQCLAEMISQAHKLFSVPADMLQVCKFTYLEAGDPVPYHELGLDRTDLGSQTAYLESCIQTVHKELKRKFKGWLHHSTPEKGVDVSYLKPADGVPLRVWKGVTEIDASTDAVFKKLWNEKYLWDGVCSQRRQVAKIDEQTEILQYVTPSPSGFTDRDHCLLRAWEYDPTSETHVIVSTSVSHPSASLMAGIRATELATRYTIERVDREKTRVSFICRVDMRGRSSEYYNKGFGPYLASSVGDLRKSFHQSCFLETTV